MSYLFIIPCFFCLIQSFFGLGSGAEIIIRLDDVDKRKKVDVKNEEGKKEKLPLYFDGESVKGSVSMQLGSLQIQMTTPPFYLGTNKPERQEA